IAEYSVRIRTSSGPSARRLAWPTATFRTATCWIARAFIGLLGAERAVCDEIRTDRLVPAIDDRKRDFVPRPARVLDRLDAAEELRRDRDDAVVDQLRVE